MNEDGGGTVHVFETQADSAAEDEERIRFDSLDELPDPIAETIRNDGRERGEVRIVGEEARPTPIETRSERGTPEPRGTP